MQATSTLGRLGARITGTTLVVLAIHFLRYAGPLIYLPLVARLLPVAEAGEFFRYQSLGILLALFVEFGLSGTALRDWARQDSAEARSRLFNLLMAERVGNAACLAAICLAAHLLGGLSATDLVVVLLFGIGGGLNMTWYFMASGRPLQGSMSEAASQAVGVAALLLALSTTRSGAWAVGGLVAGQALNVAYGLLAARRDGIRFRPGLRLALRYKLGQVPMFVVRLGALLSAAGSPWIVATLGGVVQAGLFGPGARLLGALATTLSPIADVVLPAITRHTRTVGRRRALAVSGAAFLAGAALAGPIELAVDPIAGLFYGGLRADAVEIVRLLVLSLPFVFAGQAMSLFVLVPGGRERVAALAVLVGAGLFVALVALDPTARGAAFAKLCAEATAFAVMLGLTLLARNRSGPDA